MPSQDTMQLPCAEHEQCEAAPEKKRGLQDRIEPWRLEAQALPPAERNAENEQEQEQAAEDDAVMPQHAPPPLPPRGGQPRHELLADVARDLVQPADHTIRALDFEFLDAVQALPQVFLAFRFEPLPQVGTFDRRCGFRVVQPVETPGR